MSNTLNTRDVLEVSGKKYTYYSLAKAQEAIGVDISRLPYSMKIVLENLLRHEDGLPEGQGSVSVEDVKSVTHWLERGGHHPHEIAYRPARVLMQDFTGVPAVVDLAAMRDAVVELGKDARNINPQTQVDLVIDHSVMVDSYGNAESEARNVELEMQRNRERYEFLRWGQQAFDNFRVVPPGMGICHQVNLEYLAGVVWTREEGGEMLAYPDTVVGTDSHTTMINALAVLGWGVGGIEAEAAMLGQPISMLLPDVVGVELKGQMEDGVLATDVVLRITQMLREHGVVGKFVEFYGQGARSLGLPDRATIANMAPEYGATCGFFPVDEETLSYMRLSGREEEQISLVEAYTKAQGMFYGAGARDAQYTDILSLDLSTVEPSVAGPKRPQDRIALRDVQASFRQTMQG